MDMKRMQTGIIWALIGLFFAELFALKTSLFYIVPWLDTVLHVWGGAVAGALGFLVYHHRNPRMSFSHAIVWVLGFGIAGGLLVEIAQYGAQEVFSLRHRTWIDTVSDIGADVLGAIGFLIYIRTRMKKKIQ